MIKTFFKKFVPIVLLLVSCGSYLQAQTTITTAFTNAPTRSILLVSQPHFQTFAITNNSSCPISITDISNFVIGAASFVGPTGIINFSQNGATFTLWYNPDPTKRAGAPTINAANGWINAGSSATPINNGASPGSVIPVISGLDIVVPVGATYRLALSANDSLVAHLATVPKQFTVGGVTLIAGDQLNGYWGALPGPGQNVNDISFEGSITYKTALVPPDAPVLTSSKSVICKNDVFTLTATVSPLRVNPQFTFRDPAGNIIPGTGNTRVINTPGSGPGIYTVTVVDPTCSSLSSLPASVIINQTIAKAPTVDGKTAYCLNDPFTPVTVNGVNVKWYDNPTGGLPIPFTPTFNTAIPNRDTFYVSQTINGCESDDPRTRVIYSAAAKPPLPIVNTPIFYCENTESVPVNAVGQNLKWYYQPLGGLGSTIAPTPNTSAKDTLRYYVSQSQDGCEGPRAPMEVIVTFRPNGLILASRTELCEDDSITLGYYGSAFPGSAYNWSFPDGTSILGGDFKGPLYIKLDSAGVRQVKLQVGHSNCYSEEYSQTITIDTLPKAIIEARPDICQGQTELISLSSFTASIDTFKWNFSGGTTTHYSTDQGPYGVIWESEGKKPIVLTMVNKLCTSTATDTVNVHARPDASFTIADFASDKLYCAGDSMTLTANTINASNQYSWSPARFFDNYSTLATAFARIDYTGSVKLSVKDQYGCMNSDSLYIKTKPCCEVFFPSAFSPNGDGKNDVFRIVPRPAGEQRYIELKTLKVVNRWGQTVYESVNDLRGWDGTLNGKPLDLGTYFYYLNFKCDGKIMEQKGEVVLVR